MSSSSTFVLSCIVTLTLTTLFALSRPVASTAPRAAPPKPTEIKDWFAETRRMLTWENNDDTVTRYCRQLMQSFDLLQETQKQPNKRLWRSLSEDQQLNVMRCLMWHPLVRQKPVLETQLSHCDQMIVDVGSGADIDSPEFTRWWGGASQQIRGELVQCLYDRLLTHDLASHFTSSWYPMGVDPVTGLERPAMLVWNRKNDNNE